MRIDDAELLRLRWHALLLGDRAPRTPAEVVGRFGALQAQDLGQAEWAVGVRTNGLARVDVRTALGDRLILRTWAMRGTLHLVPAVDAHWMIEHLGQRQLTGIRTRLVNTGLDSERTARAIDALAAALTVGARSRAECRDAVASVLPTVTSRQFAYLIEYAAHHAIACPATAATPGQHYALLADLVPTPVVLDRVQAHVTIAERYIRSHGPATSHDLARWAGITLTDARRAISELGDTLTTATWNDTIVHLAQELADAQPFDDDRIVLLPGFDEHIIGYSSRQPAVPAEHDRRIVPGGNGIYQPTIASAGHTIGTWRATPSGSVQTSLFTDSPLDTLATAESEWHRFNTPIATDGLAPPDIEGRNA